MAADVSYVNVEQKLVCSIIPPLSFSAHKGQYGRIGVVGGSKEYTGAPFFAAISALRVGCDLAHVICSDDAAPVIKSYSAELIVHPILQSANATNEISELLTRLHSLVIGPGLGRNEQTFGTVKEVMTVAKAMKIPLILDADALFFINTNPDVVYGYKNAVLTPNAAEFSRLYKSVMKKDLEPGNIPTDTVKSLAQKLGNVTIVRKGPEDIISDGLSVITCKEKGSPRRCGGQGDLLSGSMGVFAYWAQRENINKEKDSSSQISPIMIAALGACMLTRRCNRQAFQKFARSTITSDMIAEIKSSFSTLFPVD